MTLGRFVQTLLAWVLSYSFIFTPLAHADPSAHSALMKEMFAKLKKGGPTLEGYVKNFKDDLSPEHYEFFMNKAKEHANVQTKLTYEGDKIYVEQNGTRVGIGVTNAEKGVFNINNKSVTFTGDETPAVMWDKVSTALPQTTSSIFDMLVPKANAVAPLAIAGIILVGAAATAYVIKRVKCGRWEAVKRNCEFAKKKLADDGDMPERIGGLEANLSDVYENLKTAQTCPGDSRRPAAEACIKEIEKTITDRTDGEAYLAARKRSASGNAPKPGAAGNR